MTNSVRVDGGKPGDGDPVEGTPAYGGRVRTRTAAKQKATAAPEGFDLANYEPSKLFDAAEWGRQIAKRFFLGESLRLGTTGELVGRFSELISRPLEPCTYGAISQATSLGTSRPHYMRPSIKPLRLHDLRLLTKQLEEQGVVDGNELIDECAQKYKPLAGLAAFGRIQVDLSASDADLITAFGVWLRSYRRSVGSASISRHKSSALQLELTDWYDNRILPYSDLTLWCQWRGVRMTDECLWGILFADDDSKSTSRLRSTRRDVKVALTLKNVHALLLAE